MSQHCHHIAIFIITISSGWDLCCQLDDHNLFNFKNCSGSEFTLQTWWLSSCLSSQYLQDGICVANHTSPIDVVILSTDRSYALVRIIIVIMIMFIIEERYGPSQEAQKGSCFVEVGAPRAPRLLAPQNHQQYHNEHQYHWQIICTVTCHYSGSSSSGSSPSASSSSSANLGDWSPSSSSPYY